MSARTVKATRVPVEPVAPPPTKIVLELDDETANALWSVLDGVGQSGGVGERLAGVYSALSGLVTHPRSFSNVFETRSGFVYPREGK